jgi:N-acetylneuraminic acid mutarotase
VLLLVLVLLTTSSTVIAEPAFSDETTGNSWTTKSPMPQAISGVKAAVVKGKIYVIGGEANFEYNPDTDTWTTRKPMPTRRTNFGIAVYQNRIYTIGGRYYDSVNGSIISIISNANEVYDPLTDTWETKKPMPTARETLQANVVNGKIYLIGGIPSTHRQSVVDLKTTVLNEVYDINTDSWTTKQPLLYPVYGYASAVANNKIYVMGGANHTEPTHLTQIYDPEKDAWIFGSSLSTAVLGAAAGATTGIRAPERIYVIGGAPNIQATDVNQVYDPQNNTWALGEPIPTARGYLAVAVVNDTIFAFGGRPCLICPSLETNEQYTPFGYGNIKPVVSVMSPENKVYNESSVPLTFTVNKPVSWMQYSLDGQDNVTVTENTTLTDLPNGLHNLTVYAKYTKGSVGASENIAFTIDKPEPFPTALVAVSIASVAIIGAGVVLYFAKVKKTSGKTK